MSDIKKQRNKRHHWWPVALQSYWKDKEDYVSWIEPCGRIDRKKPDNRKIGLKIHGHTIDRGGVWETNFEDEFKIDNEVHSVVASLRQLKPLGWKPSEFLMLLKLLLRKDRSLRDMSKYYQLDERLHRNLLLLLFSLVIRSPANRNRYESYPQLLGLPPDEDVGKMNMYQSYSIAKGLCVDGPLSNQFFVLLHSPHKKFLFGDGSLDWLTPCLNGFKVRGKVLVPLTPHLCVYFCTPNAMPASPNCASLIAAPWMVDWVNEITQVYSRDKLFFLGKAPKLSESFKQVQFQAHKTKTDALVEMLDEISGMKKRGHPFAINGLGNGY